MEMGVVRWRRLALLPWQFKHHNDMFFFLGLSLDFEHLTLTSEFEHPLLLPHPSERCLSLTTIPLE